MYGVKNNIKAGDATLEAGKDLAPYDPSDFAYRRKTFFL